MGIMRLIEGIKAGTAVSVFSGGHEYIFSAGKHDPVCPEGFCRVRVRQEPMEAAAGAGGYKGPILFFDSRANRFLDFTGGLLEELFPLAGEHSCDMSSLEQEVNLRVNRYIAHNLIHQIQVGAAKYRQQDFDEQEIRERAYICYITGACGRLQIPALVFDVRQFCRLDAHQIRTGQGKYLESYARLIMLHLSEQFPSGEVAGSFLEDICRKGPDTQRNYDIICREYAKDTFVMDELEHLMKDATDSIKKAKNICQVLKVKGRVKPHVELDQEVLTVSLASDRTSPVIGRRRELYYS